MRILTLLALLILNLTTSKSMAWTKVGNGGDVVVCKDQNGDQTVELLDVYEARETYGRKPDLPRIRLDPEHMALKLNERLEKVAPARKRMFDQYIKNFFSESVFVKYELQDIPDHGYLKVPSNCETRQLIVNACSNFSDNFGELLPDPYGIPPNSKVWELDENKVSSWNQVCRGRYTINKPLWDMMSSDMQALAITHEAFMRDYRHMGDPDFEFDGPYHPVRYFNELMFTNQLRSYDFARFQKLYAAQGRVESVREHADGRLELLRESGAGAIGSLMLVPHLPLPYSDHLTEEILISHPAVVYSPSKWDPATPGLVSFFTRSLIRQPISGRGDLQFSGNVTLDLSGGGTGLKVLSGSLPGWQYIATGFTLACGHDGTGKLVDPIKARISNLSIEEDLPDGENPGLTETIYRYLPSEEFDVKNEILQVKVLPKEVSEHLNQDTLVCKDKPRLAGMMSFFATGQVFYKGRWRSVQNALLRVNLQKMQIESLTTFN